MGLVLRHGSVLIQTPSRAPLIASLLVAITAALCSGTSARADNPSLLSTYDFSRASERTRLPKYLREVSGLAAISKEDVLLHHDNDGRVWRFNISDGSLQKSPEHPNPVKGDFEGIAVTNDALLLSTSHATLLHLAAGATQALSDPIWSELPFKSRCNFEGLGISRSPEGQDQLLLPCKYPRFVEAGFPPPNDDLLYVFRHPLNPPGAAKERLEINVKPVLRDYRLPRLRPSAIEVVGDRALILAGKERVILETTLDGTLIDWRRLRWPRHRQAEGLTLMPDGTLVIADEGRWLGGTITSYEKQPVSSRP